MPIISSQFREIHVEKISVKLKKKPKTAVMAPIKNNLDIVEIVDSHVSIGGIKRALVFVYLFESKYQLKEPEEKDIGVLRIKGEILYLDNVKEMDEIVKSWKKDKKVDSKVMEQVLRVALDQAQVEAIYMAKKVLLPPPVPLPRVQPRKEK